MRLAHISDPHVGKSAAEWPALQQLIARIVALGVDALVISGDLVDVPDDAESLRRVRTLLESTGLPTFVVPGNHDVQTPGDNTVFESEFGEFPRVEHLDGGAVLLFDSFGGLPIDDRTADDRECFANTGCWLDGFVPRAQFDALQAQLQESDRFRLAVVHHHLEPSPEAQVNALLNAEEFLQWCRDSKVSHVFVGHLHETAEAADLGRVTRLRIGRSTKAPHPIGILDLATGSYSIETSITVS